MTKILDIKKSIELANGDATLAKDLFNMLIDDLSDKSDKIRDSFQENNLHNLQEQAHKLFGGTAYCAVAALRHSAAQLEQALKENEVAKLEKLVVRLCHEIQRLITNGPEFIKENWSKYT